MRITPRIGCSVGLLALVAALGCQPAPATAPAAGLRPVRVADGPELRPDTDAAITLDRGCEAGYGLKQAPSGLDPRIAYFLVRLTGPSYPAPEGRVDRVDVSAFTGCVKVVHFDELSPGRYQVVLDARDANGNHLWGDPGEVTGQVTVTAGAAPAELTLHCRYRTLPISPTPWPSPPPPSPTPTPTLPPPPSPTPNPCPVPGSASYPAAVVPNPSALFERVHGLQADANGRVYLLGLRPEAWPANRFGIGAMASVDQLGRMARFSQRSTVAPGAHLAFELEADASVHSPCYLSNFLGIVDAPPKQQQVANVTLVRRDNGYQAVSYIGTTYQGEFARPWGASTPGGSTPGETLKFLIGLGQKDGGKLPGYAIKNRGSNLPLAVDRLHLTGNRTAAVERPLSMIFDRVRKLPVWTSKRGVLTVARAGRSQDPPRVLVDRPVYGITRVAPFPLLPANRSNQVLLTTYTAGEQDVYTVDLDDHQGNPARPANLRVAFHFNAGIPHRIERGPDGRFYVLLQQGPLPVDGTAGLSSSGGGDGGDPYFHEYPGTNRIRVVQLRWDATNKRLYDPRLVADSFTDPTPSF